MQTIVLASNNPGKVREINDILAPLGLEAHPQAEFFQAEAEETGLSFVENAILKARFACAKTGLPAIADDSGLEVDALQGAPGIYSSRFAGELASDEDNLQKLLTELESMDDAARTARFVCVMVYMRHQTDPTPIICQGFWQGRILRYKTGEHGFGYDPVFYVPTHQCTSAELDKNTKNLLSHRGQALRQLVSALQKQVQR